MNAVVMIAGICGSGLLLYMFVAMLKPETFE